tara:strand:+ start:14844 stop:16949 length:2106 start_codon:yes stop_codon:yes gene_type:complete
MFLFFNPLLRLVLFWGIVGAVLMLASQNISWIDVPRVIDTVRGAFQPGGLEAVSEKEFAFSLASLIFAFAVGMAVAFGLCHVMPVLLTLRFSTGRINRGVKRRSAPGEVRRNFASNFEKLRPMLERNHLLGHAWAEFVETLYDTNSESEIRNTVRPQAFFNTGLARERFGGLKMISSVPGYFVGVGLLLTFIGLVIALYKAGNAASAANAEAMVGEMGGLLQIATFKFATSIAGLGASIVLSIIFKWYAIVIEGSFDQFNAALERSLLYESPQSISLEMKRTLRDQLEQLKDITQGQFFTRMGETMAPRLSEAISLAMKPVADNIESAVGNLTTNSRDGVQNLVKDFSESVNHGAGTELRELAATLKQLQMSMVETQTGLRGSGDDFARKLSDAADNLNRMVENAGQSFERSSGESRDALTSVVETLRQTLEKANADMDASLGNAAKGASEKLEAAMGGVLVKLAAQIGRLGEHSDQTRQQLEASNERSMEAQKAVLTGLEDTVAAISDQLRGSVETAVASVDQRFRDLASSMKGIEDALRGQKVALEGAAVEASKTAEAFGQSAQSVRAATSPLTSVGENLSATAEHLAESVSSTLEALKTAQTEISVLATGLGETNEKSGAFWETFTSKFDDVDTALGKSVDVLSQSTLDHQQRLQEHVQSVDKGLAEAVGKLASTLTQIQESAESMADSLDKAKDTQV